MIARVVDRGRVRVDGGVFELHQSSVPPSRETGSIESLRVVSIARMKLGVTRQADVQRPAETSEVRVFSCAL